jgi:hypothetical protein
MALRPIFPDVPERAVIGGQRAGDMAEMGYQDGCDRGKLSHVTLHGKLDQKWRAL